MLATAADLQAPPAAGLQQAQQPAVPVQRRTRSCAHPAAPAPPRLRPPPRRAAAWRSVRPRAAGSWWWSTAASTTRSASPTSLPCRWGRGGAGRVWGGMGRDGVGGVWESGAGGPEGRATPAPQRRLLARLCRCCCYRSSGSSAWPAAVRLLAAGACLLHTPALPMHTVPRCHAVPGVPQPQSMPPRVPPTPQHLMPEFEELSCDVVAVSADTCGKACSFVRVALCCAAPRCAAIRRLPGPPTTAPAAPTPSILHTPSHRQVDDLRGAVLAVSPDTRAGRIGFKARPPVCDALPVLRVPALHSCAACQAGRPGAALYSYSPRRPASARPPCTLGCAAQVAYGLNEEQMRRWGLYISRPLGPEESINLFSGAGGGAGLGLVAAVLNWTGSGRGAQLRAAAKCWCASPGRCLPPPPSATPPQSPPCSWSTPRACCTPWSSPTPPLPAPTSSRSRRVRRAGPRRGACPTGCTHHVGPLPAAHPLPAAALPAGIKMIADRKQPIRGTYY